MGLFQIPFTIQVADIDETMDPNKPVYDEVARVSSQKAAAVQAQPTDVVIAADTVVVCAGKVLGKPRDEADAAAMLQLLSGGDHQVMTGLTVLRGDKKVCCTEVTDIHFKPLTDREIRDYIQTGEPMDKAGAYAIQGGAALFVERICGDYFNVVGLPVCKLGKILKEMMEEEA